MGKITKVDFRSKTVKDMSGSSPSYTAIGSIDHVKMGAKKRGYYLVQDAGNPDFFAIGNDQKRLVGSCAFTHRSAIGESDNALLSMYSFASAGKVGEHHTVSIPDEEATVAAITYRFLDELARL